MVKTGFVVVLGLLGLVACGDDGAGGADAGLDGAQGEGGADGGTGDTGPPDARIEDGQVVFPDGSLDDTRSNEELLAVIPDRQCQRFTECFDSRSCLVIKNLAEHFARGAESVQAGRAEIDREKLVRCVRTLEVDTCLPSWSALSVGLSTSACHGVFVGTQPVDAPCAVGLECTPGLVCHDAQNGCDGTCVVPVADQQECGTCEGGDLLNCKAELPCNPQTSACQLGPDLDNPTMVCWPRPTERARCRDRECQEGLVCSDDNWCVRRGSPGAPCAGDPDCPGGACTGGACRIVDYEAKPGERCLANGPTSSGSIICPEGHFCGRGPGDDIGDFTWGCYPERKLGEACGESSNIARDHCEDGAYCPEANSACVARKANGADCAEDKECADNSGCLDGKCNPRPTLAKQGEACRLDWQLCEKDLFCAIGSCNPLNETCSGTCEPFRKGGESCGVFEYCECGAAAPCDGDVTVACRNEVCMLPSAEEGPCSYLQGPYCQQGLICYEDACRRFPKLGEACQTGLPCLPDAGLYCDPETNKCAAEPTAIGDPCAGDALPGGCPGQLSCIDGKCAMRSSTGGACDGDYDCLGPDERCVDGTCQERLPQGAECSEASYCTGTCVDRKCSCGG